MNKKTILDLSFSKPAIYEIKVQGSLTESEAKRLGGLELNVHKNEAGKMISTLKGKISDQSALSGILNSLYDMHIMVLSVNILKD
ncbi:MAG: hypothetical protein QNK35_01425 [Bacteroides sp.]|nr:hypothetical protein [Bacteroides sp.]